MWLKRVILLSIGICSFCFAQDRNEINSKSECFIRVYKSIMQQEDVSKKYRNLIFGMDDTNVEEENWIKLAEESAKIVGLAGDLSKLSCDISDQ